MKGKRLISVAMSALILCAQAPAFAVDAPVNTGRVITNLEFNSMVTNSIPFGMTVSKAGAFIRQYDEKVENKVLEVNEPAAKSSVEVGLRETSDSMVFSFDYMQFDTMIARTVSLTDSASNTSQIFNVATDGKVTLADGRTAFVVQPEKWYNIAVVFKMSEKRYDFYPRNVSNWYFVVFVESNPYECAYCNFCCGYSCFGGLYNPYQKGMENSRT